MAPSRGTVTVQEDKSPDAVITQNIDNLHQEGGSTNVTDIFFQGQAKKAYFRFLRTTRRLTALFLFLGFRAALVGGVAP